MKTSTRNWKKQEEPEPLHVKLEEEEFRITEELEEGDVMFL